MVRICEKKCRDSLILEHKILKGFYILQTTLAKVTDEMNKLGYCIALREKGLTSKDIKKKMKEKGFEESEIQYYLKKSDEIFLNQLIHNKKSKSDGKLNNVIKMIALALSFVLLISALYGYTTIGLIGLFFVWSLVKFSSYRK